MKSSSILTGLVMRTAQYANDTVYLYEDTTYIGYIEVKQRSMYYVKDIIENWEKYIIKPDNPNIKHEMGFNRTQ